ncbi:acetyl-CoA synthetase-like protein [Wolfiporia cocos MD-104 SS10]|uniref:Acetyl-CoA synthetase-like protein n=1 Tax=Wolfiporia cocos (strain MD-104) TaxID=742152 RepID=A0A2H3JJM5_WOLCO|nr:acetyl-CoA synthetase-like protein [Wolfiporia cocos MD-104 SS10]
MSARRILPPLPQTHARTSGTFRAPPLDGSLTFPEICDWHEKNSPEHRTFVYAGNDGQVRSISWRESARAIRVAAKLVRDRMGWQPGMAATPVVGIIAHSDGILYATLVLGIMRANYAAFPISIRNSPAAVAHLIKQVGVRHVVLGRNKGTQELFDATLEILKAQHPTADIPVASPMPVFEDLYLPESFNIPAEDLLFEFKGSDAPAWISHSSGSTAFPKPIWFTHHRVLQVLVMPWYGERDLTGSIFSAHMSPMYHGMGLLNVLWTASMGTTCGLFAPQSPPPAPDPDSVFEAAKTTDCSILMGIPAFLEVWSYNSEYVKWLATRDVVAFGGGPLNKERGDYLVSQGVPIYVSYGITETGRLNMFFPAGGKVEWEYFQLRSEITTKFIPWDDNTFELVVVSNEIYEPNVCNTTVDGRSAYATSDLLSPHPTAPGYWRIVGRTDDQIMHSTGEKTNPGPLESMLKQDSHIQDCVMFGRGKFQPGILVDPVPEYPFDPTDEARLAEFRNKIWPTVEKMNAYAPQHSRLFKEMILVSSPAKPFQFTAKGTVRRAAMIKEYEEEIEAAYEQVEKSEQSDIPLPSQWDDSTAIGFIRAVVSRIITRAVGDEDDIFQHGCDSLQATYIRNTVLRALRESTQIDTRKVETTFVYSNPTISSLAYFVAKVARGESLTESSNLSQRIEAMHKMVAKYSDNFPIHRGGISPTGGDIVLLTGSTGGLGCHILAQLADDPKVARVYAFNRPSRSGIAVRDRQRSALIQRGLEASIVDGGKIVLVEGDLTSSNFGMSSATYEEMQRSTTHIIHNAWRVDFNVSLSSFEDSIKGLRRLIELSLASPLNTPPRIVFTSSIGVLRGAAPNDRLNEVPVTAEFAAGLGYAESKWVSEQILYQAAAKTPIDPMVVRVGQLSGGPGGDWNTHEWFPSMVQTAPVLRCFPDDDRGVTWIPLDLAASAIIDFSRATNSTHTVHLAHPRPVSWHSLATIVASEFDIPLVPYAEWLANLERVAQAGDVLENGTFPSPAKRMHALQLLPTYRGLGVKTDAESSTLALGMADMEVQKAVEASSTLADVQVRQLGPQDVHQWIAYWRKAGLFGGQ